MDFPHEILGKQPWEEHPPKRWKHSSVSQTFFQVPQWATCMGQAHLET